MNVGQYLGGYAIASQRDSEPVKYGLVDTNFQYVLKPEFQSLKPAVDWPLCAGSNTQLSGLKNGPPIFYIGKRFGSDETVAISPKGELLFVFPKSVSPEPPYPFHGAICCHIQESSTGPDRTIYLDLTGHEVPIPFKMPSVEGAKFIEAGSDRLVKVINDKSIGEN